MPSTTLMTLAPGWRWMLTMIAGVLSAQAASLVFSGPSIDVGDVATAAPARRCGRRRSTRGTRRRPELVVGVDRRACVGPSKLPLALLTLALPIVGAQIVDVEPEAASARRLAWMRTAGRWPPLMLTRPTPGNCEIFCASRVSASPRTFGQRQRLRGQRQREHRRIGRIDLGVDRRRRQVRRQQIAGRVDRRLHFLLGDVETQSADRTAA